MRRFVIFFVIMNSCHILGLQHWQINIWIEVRIKDIIRKKVESPFIMSNLKCRAVIIDLTAVPSRFGLNSVATFLMWGELYLFSKLLLRVIRSKYLGRISHAYQTCALTHFYGFRLKLFSCICFQMSLCFKTGLKKKKHVCEPRPTYDPCNITSSQPAHCAVTPGYHGPLWQPHHRTDEHHDI